MNVECEDFLWAGLHGPGKTGVLPREIIDNMINEGLIQNHKQAWRTLEKWSRKDWYDYGTAIDLGWKEIDERP